jgi:fidgetin-like protein 1
MRIHIDQPDDEARLQLVCSLLKDVKNSITQGELVRIVKRLQGYSASDIKSVVKEACMEPVRSEIKRDMILTV